VDFEWDEEKAASNERKHGVAFGYAVAVFLDPWRYERLDSAIDYGEERWSITGLIGREEIVVAFTFRGEKTRIISARRASRDERREYWQDRLLHS
jgi:uncharacterized DUF497 family protein